MRFVFTFIMLAFLSVTLLQCTQTHQQPYDDDMMVEPVERDLPDIMNDGKLIALTGNNTTSYFIYRGQPKGYEYELLEKLADFLGLELEIRITEDMDEVFDLLNKGQGDIVAHNMTITRERSKQVAFTVPVNNTRQVLVQQKPENWRQLTRRELNDQLIRNQIDLLNKPIYVRKNSSYYARLRNLEEELGGEIDIRTVPGHLSTEQLIEMVAEGRIPFTVADENIARINEVFHQNIDIETPVSFPQRVGWAVRNNAPQLRDTVNAWLEEMKSSVEYYVIYNKYFENRRAHRQRVQSDFFSLTGSQLTPYDEILQNLTRETTFDWRLLASLMFQESRFDPNAVSWAGAQGLMQIMPATAQKVGVRDPFNPYQSIQGGLRYLQYLEDFWSKRISDDDERIKFILGSYNVGPGHVMDARRLAEKYDHNPDIWDGHVAKFLRKKSQPRYYMDEVVRYGYCRGEEPFHYVTQILNRYNHYKNFALPALPMEVSR